MISNQSQYTILYDRYSQRLTLVHVLRKKYASPVIAFAVFFANTVGTDNFLYYPCEDIKGGPGLFFICFVIMMILIGIPLMCLETALGQFRHGGAMKAWDCFPLMGGVVIAGLICGFFWVLTASLMATYSLYYLFAGVYNCFKDIYTPMWARCDQAWNSYGCQNHGTMLNLRRENLYSADFPSNFTPAEIDYFESITSQSSNNPTNFCVPSLEIIACAVLTYIVVFLCAIHGVASIGKAILVLWFICISCFIVLCFGIIIASPKSYSLAEGILTLLIPTHYEDLYSAKLWAVVGRLVFFSLLLGQSSLLTLSSFNSPRDPIMSWSVCIGSVIILINIAAAFMAYSLLGVVGNKLDVPTESMCRTNDQYFLWFVWRFAFYIFPTGFCAIPFSSFWAIFFYLMLFTASCSSCAALSDSHITAIMDMFPKLRIGRRESYARVGYFIILAVSSHRIICFGCVAQVGILAL